jgi:Flp pilus assembly protein TadD
LAKLAEAVEQHPNDDSLLFLLGYQLWFDGKRDQAEVLFKRAATLTLDRTHIDRFLNVKRAE